MERLPAPQTAPSVGGVVPPHPFRLAVVADATVAGGAEVYLAGLIRGLPPEVEVTLVVPPQAPVVVVDAARRRGATVHARLPRPRHKLDVVNVVRLMRLLRALEADVILVNLRTAAATRYPLAGAVASRARAVATLHLALPVVRPLQRMLLRAAFRRLDAAIAVSREVAGQLSSQLGMPERAIHLVRNGVEVGPQVEIRYGERLQIGAMGRFHRQKGFDVLLEAIRVATERHARLRLSIAGEGELRNALERQAAGLDVVFPGFVDRRRYLEGLDVFCLPSRYEGTPLALLEAMMAGLPCVAAAVGDVPEVLDGAGIVVPPEDPEALAEALLSLAHSLELRARLGRAARERALAAYTVERMVTDTHRVLSSVLQK